MGVGGCYRVVKFCFFLEENVGSLGCGCLSWSWGGECGGEMENWGCG